MSCYLRVSGKNFNVDHYLKKHPCKVAAVYRRGEPELKTKRRRKKITYSGFNILVSNKGMSKIAQQIKDAVSFLSDNDNAAEIKTLMKYPGVEGASLDFGIKLKNPGKYPVQWYDFPTELVKLAGNLRLGLTVTLYCCWD